MTTATHTDRVPYTPAAMSDAWACQQVVLAFTAALDRLDADEMTRHFVADGTWRRPSGDVVGHDGIRAFVANVPAGTVMRHVVTNTRVGVLADDRLLSESYFTAYVRGPGDDTTQVTPTAVGHYADTLERRGSDWTIMERVVDFALTA